MSMVDTVMVVDDDEIVRFLVKQVIEEAHLANSIIDVRDGAEGIDYLIKNCKNGICPELILLDINMPILDGFEFLKLKNTLPGVKEIPSKIVMVSSSSSPHEIKKAKDLGALDYIVKPITEEKIIETINKIV